MGPEEWEGQSYLVDIETTALAIPALIQVTPTKRYDVVQSDVIAVPRSADRGLDLRILSTAIRYRPEGDGHIIFVPNDLPVKSIDDLKGKKIGVTSLGSTGFHNVRFALGEGFGANVDITDGDFHWVELSPAALTVALRQKSIDAAVFSLTSTYAAKLGGEFRPAVFAGKRMFELFGVEMIFRRERRLPGKARRTPRSLSGVRSDADGVAAYMRAHPDEVYPIIGKEQNVDPKLFVGLQATLAEFPAMLQEKDITALAKEWELAKKYKLLTSVPDVKQFVWSGVDIQVDGHIAMIDLYYASTANGFRGTLALEETGLPYRPHKLDLYNGDQNQADFRRINPLGAVPVLLDPEGPDGQPLLLTQSIAILLYAAERSGRSIPASPVRRWNMFQWMSLAATDVAGANTAINQLLRCLTGEFRKHRIPRGAPAEIFARL